MRSNWGLLLASLLALLISLSLGARVAFLPDVSIGGASIRWFYPSLMAQSAPCMHGRQKFYRSNSIYCSMNFLDMPNVFESNTKRYEVEWLNYMKESLDLSSYDVVVGHGSSAEAVLRYMEQPHYKPLRSVVVLDANDIYTAGERHGRRFHHSKIKRNSLTSHVIVGATTSAGRKNCQELKRELYKYRNYDNDKDVSACLDDLETRLYSAPSSSECTVTDANRLTADEAEANSEEAVFALNNLLEFCIKQSLKKVIA